MEASNVPSGFRGPGSESVEDQLSDLRMLATGLTSVMSALLEKLRAYHSLIEDELEQTPGARADLRNCQELIGRMVDMLPVLEVEARENTPCDMDALDLRTLLQGLCHRVERILAGRVELVIHETGARRTGSGSGSGEDLIVRGNLFPVQDLLMQVALVVGRFLGRLLVEAGIDVVPARLRQNIQDSGVEGRYAWVRFSGSAGAGPEWEARVGFPEVFIAPSLAGEEIDVVDLFRIAGACRASGGAVFAKPRGGLSDLLVVLPLQPDAEATRSGDELDISSALAGSETVLLVDDEDTIWDVIIDMLQELGYSVILAANGREAVEIYQANPGAVDVVILDMLMPEFDGVRTFEEIRRIDPESRILLSSGYVSARDVQGLLASGAAGFLPKPYRMKDLAVTLRRILDGCPGGEGGREAATGVSPAQEE